MNYMRPTKTMTAKAARPIAKAIGAGITPSMRAVMPNASEPTANK